jgi:hypothetical protein
VKEEHVLHVRAYQSKARHQARLIMSNKRWGRMCGKKIEDDVPLENVSNLLFFFVEILLHIESKFLSLC